MLPSLGGARCMTQPGQHAPIQQSWEEGGRGGALGALIVSFGCSPPSVLASPAPRSSRIMATWAGNSRWNRAAEVNRSVRLGRFWRDGAEEVAAHQAVWFSARSFRAMFMAWKPCRVASSMPRRTNGPTSKPENLSP